MINPTNSTPPDSFITFFELINKLYLGRLVLRRIINWNLSELATAFLTLIWNQVKTFLSQVFNNSLKALATTVQRIIIICKVANVGSEKIYQ